MVKVTRYDKDGKVKEEKTYPSSKDGKAEMVKDSLEHSESWKAEVPMVVEEVKP